MALDSALLTRNRVFAAKVETTTGTPITLGASDGVFNIFDSKIDATIPATERQGQGTLSPLAPVPGPRMGKATFKTEIIGGVTAPKWMSVLLAGCGFAVTTGTTYAPVTGGTTTLTMGHYQAGRLLQISGAKGKVKITLEAGKPGMLDFEYDGVWQPPTSAALLAPNYPPTIPPRFAGATLTLGGVSTYRIGKMEIDVENTLVMREDANDVSGNHACEIVDRKISVKLSPEALPLSTHDFFADHLAATSIAMSMTIGTTGNQVTIACPNLIMLNPPQYEDGNGIYRDSLELVACRSSSAGDDEITIASA